MKPTRFSFGWIVALAFGGLLGCSGMQTETQSARIISIPPGMRAVSIRVNGSAGIVPGAHVDVLVTGDATETQTATVLQDVEVAASEPRSLGYYPANLSERCRKANARKPTGPHSVGCAQVTIHDITGKAAARGAEPAKLRNARC
jgi:hypothetical protein